MSLLKYADPLSMISTQRSECAIAKLFNLVMSLILTLAMQSFANADFAVSITQVGPDVVVNSQGAVDLSSLAFSGTLSDRSGLIRPFNDGELGSGSSALVTGAAFIAGSKPSQDFYLFAANSSGPIGFGTAGEFTFPNSGSGDLHGFPPTLATTGELNMQFYLPEGYQLGDTLQSEMNFANTTTTALGIDTDAFQWNAGGNNITLNVAAIPEPFAAPLWIGACAAIGLFRRRNRCN